MAAFSASSSISLSCLAAASRAALAWASLRDATSSSLALRTSSISFRASSSSLSLCARCSRIWAWYWGRRRRAGRFAWEGPGRGGVWV